MQTVAPVDIDGLMWRQNVLAHDTPQALSPGRGADAKFTMPLMIDAKAHRTRSRTQTTAHAAFRVLSGRP
jgi:hypothetical protein